MVIKGVEPAGLGGEPSGVVRLMNAKPLAGQGVPSLEEIEEIEGEGEVEAREFGRRR